MQRVLLTLLVMVLGLAAAGPLAGAAPKPNAFNFAMSGAPVVPGPGDPDATPNGNVILFFDKPYTVCGAVGTQNLARPITALEVHRAPPGEAGPTVIVFDLTRAGPSDTDGCADVDKPLMQDIQRNPELYYLDAHNAEFPAGAVRGQLG